MVYCGKPSKGCSTCRERKIRCDQKEPHCGQCEKRQLQCPGYRNMVDLMFRDESNHVIKKASRSRGRTRRAKPSLKLQLRPGASARSRTSRSALTTPPSPSPSSPAQTTTSSSSSSGSYVPSLPLPEDLPNRLALLSQSQNVSTSLARFGILGADSDSESESEDEYARTRAIHQLTNGGMILRCALSRPLREKGTAFFFSRYVAKDSSCYENYAFIYDVWSPPGLTKRGTERSDCVTASMAAVGLSGLAQLTRSPDTMNLARQSYGIALQLTNAAIKDSSDAIKDSTMLSVLILGTYEFVSGRTPATMRAWQEHVNGAATLACMRGARQFATKAGTQMFLMLCHSLLISCVQLDLPMPPALVTLRRELGRMSSRDDGFTWQVVDQFCKGLQVRHDIKSGKLRDLDEIIRLLSEVEDTFTLLVKKLPPMWRYRRGYLVRPHPGVLGYACHLYKGLGLATTWNGMRTVRILIQETIIEQLLLAAPYEALPPQYQLQLAKAIKLQQKLGEAVVGSIPQHFGIVSFADILQHQDDSIVATLEAKRSPYELLSTPPMSPGTNSQPTSPSLRPTLLDPTQSQSGPDCDASRFMTLATSSTTIIWPLYTTGMSSCCTQEMRDYVVDRLYACHRETGREQARFVAGFVEAKVELPIWERVPMHLLPQLPPGSIPTLF
jgi:hypothetical protein